MNDAGPLLRRSRSARNTLLGRVLLGPWLSPARCATRPFRSGAATCASRRADRCTSRRLPRSRTGSMSAARFSGTLLVFGVGGLALRSAPCAVSRTPRRRPTRLSAPSSTAAGWRLLFLNNYHGCGIHDLPGRAVFALATVYHRRRDGYLARMAASSCAGTASGRVLRDARGRSGRASAGTGSFPRPAGGAHGLAVPAFKAAEPIEAGRRRRALRLRCTGARRSTHRRPPGTTTPRGSPADIEVCAPTHPRHATELDRRLADVRNASPALASRSGVHALGRAGGRGLAGWPTRGRHAVDRRAGRPASPRSGCALICCSPRPAAIRSCMRSPAACRSSRRRRSTSTGRRVSAAIAVRRDASRRTPVARRLPRPAHRL